MGGKPYSRRRHSAAGGDGRSEDERVLAAYEFFAATYGWSFQEVRETLTDEQFVAYLDTASDRLREEAESRVEAARMGVVFAYNAKAYARWRRAMDKLAGKSPGLTGAGLEAAVKSLALTNPEYVVVGG